MVGNALWIIKSATPRGRDFITQTKIYKDADSAKIIYHLNYIHSVVAQYVVL